jgi:hypothetical protein
MNTLRDFLSDPKTWLSGAALLVSLFSALISWRSSRNSTRALAISEGQEARHRPQLRIYLVKAYRHRAPQRRLFRFLVSISNPTDINNSVARAELQVRYSLQPDLEAVCRIPHQAELADSDAETDRAATVFLLPLRIDAHQTASGWLLFALEDRVIGARSVDSHCLIFEDTHGISTTSEDIPINDWAEIAERDEAKEDHDNAPASRGPSR